MDPMQMDVHVVSAAFLFLFLLLNCNRDLLAAVEADSSSDVVEWETAFTTDLLEQSTMNEDTVIEVVVRHFRLWTSLQVLDEDLGFWVKPRSTTWFSKFLLEEYDNNRWVQMFWMTKQSLLTLTQLLTPTIRRRDTNYRQVVPVTVRVACTFFKLCHGASFLICSELFAVGRSTISIMLREVVHAVNDVLQKEMAWPTTEGFTSIVESFQRLCGLPGVMGAIDGTHFEISKPRFGTADYYYFKSGGYTMTCMAVVDSSKRFMNLNVGMPGSTNDSRVLRRSGLYHRAQRHTLWDNSLSFQGFSPYLLGDAGYPLIPWLMVPHCQNKQLSIAEQLYNRHLSKGRVVVENAFGMLKQSFRELLSKSELHVTFLPGVVMCCGILHNVLLQQSHEEVERLLHILQVEATSSNLSAPDDRAGGPVNVQAEPVVEAESQLKRRELGVFLFV